MPAEGNARGGTEVLVDERNRDVAGAGVVERDGCRLGGDDLPVGILQQIAEDLDDDALVVDDEDPGLDHPAQDRPAEWAVKGSQRLRRVGKSAPFYLRCTPADPRRRTGGSVASMHGQLTAVRSLRVSARLLVRG